MEFLSTSQLIKKLNRNEWQIHQNVNHETPQKQNHLI